MARLRLLNVRLDGEGAAVTTTILSVAGLVVAVVLGIPSWLVLRSIFRQARLADAEMQQKQIDKAVQPYQVRIDAMDKKITELQTDVRDRDKTIETRNARIEYLEDRLYGRRGESK